MISHNGAAMRFNSHGNLIVHRFLVDCDRYYFDAKLTKADGWTQYDTDQDAWYFGIWVNVTRREIVTYAEGDYYWTKAVTNEMLADELRDMAEFHGDPPPFAIVYDAANGTRTECYDPNARPTVKP